MTIGSCSSEEAFAGAFGESTCFTLASNNAQWEGILLSIPQLPLASKSLAPPSSPTCTIIARKGLKIYPCPFLASLWEEAILKWKAMLYYVIGWDDGQNNQTRPGVGDESPTTDSPGFTTPPWCHCSQRTPWWPGWDAIFCGYTVLQSL